MTRMGSFPIWQPLVGQSHCMDTRIGPHIMWNVTVDKEITDDLSVRVNVNNVFDGIHPDDATMTSYPYFFQQYSPIGREGVSKSPTSSTDPPATHEARRKPGFFFAR